MINHETSTGTTSTACSVTGSVVTIADMAANAAGKQFNFRVLATFGGTGTSAITNAVTKVSTYTIDEKSSLLTITRGTTWTKAATPKIGIEAVHTTGATPLLTAGQIGTNANAHSLQVSQTLGVATTASSILTIVLPLTKTNPGADG
jgi:hypothetical protein